MGQTLGRPRQRTGTGRGRRKPPVRSTRPVMWLWRYVVVERKYPLQRSGTFTPESRTAEFVAGMTGASSPAPADTINFGGER